MIKEDKLDLAAGQRPEEGFKSIDIVPGPKVDYVMDLQKYPWPIESESVSELNCSHYVEHIPHDINNPNDKRDGLIQFMEECYRILKPGGRFTIRAPYFSSMRAWGDPTHTRAICDYTFYYFNKKWREDNGLDHYGINCDFDLENSYIINSECDIMLRSEEVKQKAFKHDINIIDDLNTTLIKL